MSPIQPPHVTAGPTQAGPSRSLVLLLATGAGLSVASLYYSQPMLGVLGPDLQAGDRLVGLVPTLTQLGYALGILLLAPLGDSYDRRLIILAKAALLALALLLSGFAPGIAWLLVASLAVGLTATTPRWPTGAVGGGRKAPGIGPGSLQA
jgi:predicted MFS family arabinose efflux permease